MTLQYLFGKFVREVDVKVILERESDDTVVHAVKVMIYSELLRCSPDIHAYASVCVNACAYFRHGMARWSIARAACTHCMMILASSYAHTSAQKSI